MHFQNVFKIIGVFLMFFSLTMLPPMIIAEWYHEAVMSVFLLAALTAFFVGFIFWLPSRLSSRELRAREGFLIVTLLWVVLSFFGSLPFIFYESLHISWIDALFESVAGLTTTGATVLINLDVFPRSLLYYRQQLQFIGGGGIILFGIAILPMLGVGGMQLFRAEMPGPFKEDKLTPRIAETAKTLWIIYVGLTVLCIASYYTAGMSVFDAICHGYSTVSTGGFSTHDQNLYFYKQANILWVAIFFMILGAINFSLHFVALRGKTFRHYWQDDECKTFLMYMAVLVVIIGLTLRFYSFFSSDAELWLNSLFQVVSFCTTTGFASSQYNLWPTFLPILLMMLCLIGGCSGSTAGGIKMIRVILLYKQWVREVHRLIHPNGYYVIKLGQKPLQPRTLDAIWGFFGIFVVFFVVLLLLLLASGLDFLSAFSSLVATISSSGMGLGKVTDHFKDINDTSKLLLSLSMLAGRLEFFTLLVLFSRNYWRS